MVVACLRNGTLDYVVVKWSAEISFNGDIFLGRVCLKSRLAPWHLLPQVEEDIQGGSGDVEAEEGL